MSVIGRWFCCCWFIVLSTFHCLLGFFVGLCFGMHYFMSFLVLQSSKQGKESRLLCFSFVFWMSCYCKCVVALPQSTMSWSAVWWLWYFLSIIIYPYDKQADAIDTLNTTFRYLDDILNIQVLVKKKILFPPRSFFLRETERNIFLNFLLL